MDSENNRLAWEALYDIHGDGDRDKIFDELYEIAARQMGSVHLRALIAKRAAEVRRERS